jgi:hypothetical protein
MAFQGLFTGGVKIRNLNGYLIAVNGEVFATSNTGGTTYAFFYRAKITITSGDPGSGHIIWNNATQTSATQINVSHLTDAPVEDIDIYLTAIVPGNRLIIQDRDNSERFQIWTVSGAPTEIGSVYWTIPVTLVQSQGAAFTNNHDLLFAIVSGGSGGGGTTTNAITFNNGGAGAASGTSFNGGTAVTISYNTIGAQAANANLTSLAGLSFGTTAFVKMTGANTFTLDTNTYLTANQTITLSGNVTGSGTTSITTTIANNVVTNAMLAQIATARIRGRVTAGTGNVEDLTGTQATTLLDTFTSALKGLAPASGGGTTNFLRADGTWAAPPGGGGGTTTNSITFNNGGSGAASGTSFNGSSAVTISHNTIGAQPLANNLTSLAGLTYASGTPFVKMSAAGTFSLDTNTYLTGNQTITLSGDVSGSGATSISTTIGNNAVTLAKFQQISTSSFLGRVTAGTGNVEVLTGTQATTLIDVFTTSLKGLAPASGGGTTNFLRADGTWAAPPGGGGGGTTTFAVTFNNSGTGAASGTTFDGSVARTISYNTLGANKVITSGTAAPTGGVDGDIYLQYDVSLLTGSGSTNYIPKFTSSSAIGNSQIFDNGTNVGIGTTTPAYTFHAVSSSVSIGAFRNSGTADGQLLVGNTVSDLALRILASGDALIFSDNSRYLAFGTNGGTERMRITSGGNVGIGYTAPAAKLAVNGTALINTNTDNGVDKLQVNGSAIASTLKVNTSGQTVTISSYYNGGTGKNIWIGGGGLSSTSGDENTALGVDAMLNNTSGYYNTAIGFSALKTNTSGYANDAFGHATLASNTTGYRNVSFGASSLNANTTGYENMAIGHLALVKNTTGYRNVSIGAISMFENTTGYSNIAFGYDAGRRISGGGANQTSNTSIYIGEDTRSSANGNTNEMVFGHTAIGQGSNTVTLGNSSITKTFLRGNTMVNTTTDNGVDELQVNGSIQGTGFNQAYTARTTTYTAANTDYFIDCTSGSFTVNLFTAVGNTGRILIIKNSGTGTITVDPDGSQTIDGATTQTLSTQWSRVHIISDGANWKIISN